LKAEKKEQRGFYRRERRRGAREREAELGEKTFYSRK